MASLVQQGSWSSPSILAGYGLSAKIGPTEQTTTDTMRLNSRSGGKFSGKGNWMQDYRPKPIMGSGRPKVMYDYEKGDGVVVQRRPEGLVNRKIGKFKKPFSKSLTKTLAKNAGFGPQKNVDGEMVPRNDAGNNQNSVIPGWLDKMENYAPSSGFRSRESAGNTPTGPPTERDAIMQAPSEDRSSVSSYKTAERYEPPTITYGTNTYGVNVTRAPTAPHNSQDMQDLKRIPSYDGRDYKNKRLRLDASDKKRKIIVENGQNKRLRIDTSDKKRKVNVENGPSKKRLIDYK